MFKAYPHNNPEFSKPLRTLALLRCLSNLFVCFVHTVWKHFMHAKLSEEVCISRGEACRARCDMPSAFPHSALLSLSLCSFLYSLLYLQNKRSKDTHFSEWGVNVVAVLRCVALFLTDSFVSSDSQRCYNSTSDDVDLLLVFQMAYHLEEKVLA